MTETVEVQRRVRDVAVLDRPSAPATDRPSGRPTVLAPFTGLLQPDVAPGQWPPPALSYLALAAILAAPRHDHQARSLDDPDRTATDESSRPANASAIDGRDDELRVREVIRRAPPTADTGTADATGNPDAARTENDTGTLGDARIGPRSRRTAPASFDPDSRALERRSRERVRRSTRDPRIRQRGSSAVKSDVPAPSTVVRSNRADEPDDGNSPLDHGRSPSDASRRATREGDGEQPTVAGEHPAAEDFSKADFDGTTGTARSSTGENLRARTVLRDPGRAPQVATTVTERTVTHLVDPADVEGEHSSTASAVSTSTGGGRDRREGAAASLDPVPLAVTAAGPARAGPPVGRGTADNDPSAFERPAPTVQDAPRLTVRRDRKASDASRSSGRNRSAGRSGSVSGMAAGSSVGDRAGSSADDRAGSSPGGRTGPAGSAGGRSSNAGETGRAGTEFESDPAALERALDVPRLADRLYRELERKMRIERERRGLR